jgi:hypothetical protein
VFSVDLLVFLEKDFLLIICNVHLLQKTGSSTCSARWYYNYWGYYWGRFWRVGPIGTVSINGAGCAQWRTVLAFSFIAWFLHLLSGILGVYVFRTYIRLDETKRDIKHHAEKLTKPEARANGYNRNVEERNGTAENV